MNQNTLSELPYRRDVGAIKFSASMRRDARLVIFSAAFASLTVGALLSVLKGELLPQNERLPGLTVADANSANPALVVTSLQSSGSAKEAGIRVGDDVVAINRHPVMSMSDIRDILRHNASAQIELRVSHGETLTDVSLSRYREEAHGSQNIAR